MPGNGLPDLLTNRVFMVGLLSWFLAQIGKIFTHLFKKREWRWDACLQPGGMPSSHSSLCVGVTTAIAWQQGLGSPLFAAALCFSLCVMYDAMGIRRHAGKQAEALNKVISELRKDDPQSAIKAEVLKEVLGHTPRQVAAGAVLGVLVGLAMPGGPWCC